MYGYIGTLLRVDLTTRTIWDEPLNEDHARAYLGGSGLAARYLLDLIDGDEDPLSPGNPMIVMAGPMVGTSMPSAGRYSVSALSPLTGIWGESTQGASSALSCALQATTAL